MLRLNQGTQAGFSDPLVVRRRGRRPSAFEILNASRNRIANNTITRIVPREPFPGNVLGRLPAWREANGAGIWVSAGSNENEIVGNTFNDIASAAVVLEGNRNHVATRSVRDTVRDLGTDNRVIARDTSAIRQELGPADRQKAEAGLPLPDVNHNDYFSDRQEVVRATRAFLLPPSDTVEYVVLNPVPGPCGADVSSHFLVILTAVLSDRERSQVHFHRTGRIPPGQNEQIIKDSRSVLDVHEARQPLRTVLRKVGQFPRPADHDHTLDPECIQDRDDVLGAGRVVPQALERRRAATRSAGGDGEDTVLIYEAACKVREIIGLIGRGGAEQDRHSLAAKVQIVDRHAANLYDVSLIWKLNLNRTGLSAAQT